MGLKYCLQCGRTADEKCISCAWGVCLVWHRHKWKGEPREPDEKVNQDTGERIIRRLNS